MTNISKELSGVKRNVRLVSYTTFKIGGKAKYFFVAKTKEDLIEAVKTANKLRLPFFILGGGSNILVSNKGFNGLVIKFGQPLSAYVSKGLEWAVGIPGTIQGAVWGNAGAFKKSMKDVVESVEVFDIKTGKVKIFKNKDCRFSYRNSIFRKKKNLIILSVKIKPKKSSSKKIKQYLDSRKKTQPLSFPSAGSIFKNKKLKIKNKKLLKEFPELKEFNKRKLIPAGFLIEKCNLKGRRIENVKISEKHANFIVNLGQGRAKDVKKLINLAKQKVKNKFKIKLEEEISILSKSTNRR